jgi:serine/threonine-protein kinase
MADVYLADDSQLGRRVALKILHRRFADDPAFVERFRQEAQSAAGLNHANIVSVYDRGEFDGTSYIAMEYLQGVTLKQLIRDQAPLDPARSVAIALQIAQAARFAHRGGVIHRDLKPQNVMVDPEGMVTVTDFGIARAGAAGMTEAGSILGTAHYISPEQAQGAQVSERSDVYSIGVILYEMLTGVVPFDAESPVAIAMKQVNEPPVPPIDRAPAVPADLNDVVLWTMRKSQADRPADCDELIGALDSIGERIRSGADGSATVAFAAPSPVVIPAIAAASTDVNAEQDDQPEDESASRRKWWIAGALVAALVAAGALAFFLTQPAKVTMPLVVGKDLQTATTILANAGLKSAPSVQRVQSDKPKDEVIRQDPLADAKVNEDASVTLLVSGGPGTAQIPPVTGMSEAAALKALTKAGFKVKVVPTASDTVQLGFAIGTDPPAGTGFDIGSTLVLNISSGAAQIAVPDVTGKSLGDARSSLEAAGFVVDSSQTVANSGKPDGTVLSQAPSSGAKAAKGSTVTLTIASGPTTVTIPNAVGKTQTVATNLVNSAGLNALSNSVSPADDPRCTGSNNGLVIAQNPAPGGKAAQGTQVTLTVCSAPATTTTTTTP